MSPPTKGSQHGIQSSSQAISQEKEIRWTKRELGEPRETMEEMTGLYGQLEKGSLCAGEIQGRGQGEKVGEDQNEILTEPGGLCVHGMTVGTPQLTTCLEFLSDMATSTHSTTSLS